jgi:hypothetical protein
MHDVGKVPLDQCDLHILEVCFADFKVGGLRIPAVFDVVLVGGVRLDPGMHVKICVALVVAFDEPILIRAGQICKHHIRLPFLGGCALGILPRLGGFQSR